MNKSEINKILCEELVEGTKQMFADMLMIEITAGDTVVGKGGPVPSNITSMLGIGGELKGMLAVHCTGDAAKNITSGFLGMDVPELDDDVKDAIGEVANMIAGNLKVSFKKLDIGIELALPSSIIGESYRIGGFTDANCLSVPFEIDGKLFWVELKYLYNSN